MEAIIQNQKINRRRIPAVNPVRAQRSSAGGLSPDAGNIFTSVIGLVTRPDQFTLFAGGGILVLLVLSLFMLNPLEVPAGLRFSATIIDLPVDEDLPSLLQTRMEGLDRGMEDGEEKILPPAPTVLSAVSFFRHTVRPGDSVSAISKRYGISMSTLISFNRLENARSLKAGTTLRVPSQNGLSYTVRKGDNLSGIAKTYGVTLNALLDTNNMTSAVLTPGMELFVPGAAMRSMDIRKALGELFSRPISGRLTSGYGMRNDPFTGVRRFHYGIDLAAPTGTPVKAAMEGTVAMVGVHPTYGKYIIVQHPDGYQTWYAHLNDIRVKSGQKVSDGQLVGEVGSTGYSTGPHLHFSIFKRGNALDPSKYLN